VIFCGCIDVEKEGANIFMKAHINIVLLYWEKDIPLSIINPSIYIHLHNK
jgi:hypothetical protein